LILVKQFLLVVSILVEQIIELVHLEVEVLEGDLELTDFTVV
jgi:hypothetical protein